MGAEPGEGFVDAFLEGELGSAEDGISFVHWGGCRSGWGPQCRLRPVSVPVGRPRRPVSSNLGSVVGCGLPVVQLEWIPEDDLRR